MKAKSIKGNSAEEIRVALVESMADGFTPTLAIVFVSIKQDRAAISTMLDQKGLAIYGATTNGEFIDEELEKGSIAILLLDIDRNYFTVQFEELDGKDPREVTKAMAQKVSAKFAKASFLIAASHLETNAEELLFGFEDISGKEANVFGAMAGDDFAFKEQFVFTNEKDSNRAIVAIALDNDKIIVKGRATCGWKTIGTPKTITRSIGNRVYTIDDKPAIDVLAKYSGITNVTQENQNLLMELAISLPLQLLRENGDPIMRPCALIHWEDHSFTCAASMPQGSKVSFTLPADFDVIEKVIHVCEELKETEIPEADAVIIYNCAGRFLTLGPMMTKEIEGINKVWNVPMAGFFSNAEMGRSLNGGLDLHNITVCCVALKEKPIAG